ncbi:MAG: hypothetical protein ABEJ93_03470 [Candidatus Nanohalobium sp.]
MALQQVEGSGSELGFKEARDEIGLDEIPDYLEVKEFDDEEELKQYVSNLRHALPGEKQDITMEEESFESEFHRDIASVLDGESVWNYMKDPMLGNMYRQIEDLLGNEFDGAHIHKHSGSGDEGVVGIGVHYDGKTASVEISHCGDNITGIDIRDYEESRVPIY